MSSYSLKAISPIDGRYSKKVNVLRSIFSEFALLKFRIQIEISWLQQLSKIPEIEEIPLFSIHENTFLNNIIINFDEQDAKRIKFLENITNHDMKAVEYFLKEKISSMPNLARISEFIHFACTSEDINNLSYALMLKISRSNIIVPYWDKIINAIKVFSLKYKNIPLLSRTHGQPATPSTVGKEMVNVAYRLQQQLNKLKNIKILGKFNGAVGNYNAHLSAYPQLDWHSLSKKFVNSLGISWNPYTTQIEPHDYIAELFNCITLFNIILIDFNRNIWGYIALNYFKQKVHINEVGSSTMPHKVNPINFENAEGNLGLSNALNNYFTNKLPISRWQRDLTDSTVLRNLGASVAYAIIAYQSTLQGIDELEINQDCLSKELNNNWSVLAEPIQTVMRRYGIKNSYEQLKEFTRGKYLDANKIQDFIDNLNLPEKAKISLKQLTPASYIGYAIQLVDDFFHKQLS